MSMNKCQLITMLTGLQLTQITKDVMQYVVCVNTIVDTIVGWLRLCLPRNALAGNRGRQTLFIYMYIRYHGYRSSYELEVEHYMLIDAL